MILYQFNNFDKVGVSTTKILINIRIKILLNNWLLSDWIHCIFLPQLLLGLFIC